MEFLLANVEVGSAGQHMCNSAMRAICEKAWPSVPVAPVMRIGRAFTLLLGRVSKRRRP